MQDIISETQDELDFRDKVVKISLGASVCRGNAMAAPGHASIWHGGAAASQQSEPADAQPARAGFEHLIVATSTQCHIYSTSNWNTPHIFDLKDTVTLLQQCERCFLLMDNATGIQLFTYEGRQICNPKSQGEALWQRAALAIRVPGGGRRAHPP